MLMTEIPLPQAPTVPTQPAPAACDLPMTVDVVPEFRYRLKTMEASSVEYGPCEVCGKACSEVFLQVEERRYSNAWTSGWTQHACTRLFGHRHCLLGRRRRLDPERWPTPETKRIAAATPEEAIRGLLDAAREVNRLNALVGPETYWQSGHRQHTPQAHEAWHQLLYALSAAEARIGLFFDVLPTPQRSSAIRQAQGLCEYALDLLTQAQRDELAAIETCASIE